MKYVTLQQLEKDFDRIFDDVVENKEHYVITATYVKEDGSQENQKVALIPYTDYNFLKSTYEDWVQS